MAVRYSQATEKTCPRTVAVPCCICLFPYTLLWHVSRLQVAGRGRLQIVAGERQSSNVTTKRRLTGGPGLPPIDGGVSSAAYKTPSICTTLQKSLGTHTRVSIASNVVCCTSETCSESQSAQCIKSSVSVGASVGLVWSRCSNQQGEWYVCSAQWHAAGCQ